MSELMKRVREHYQELYSNKIHIEEYDLEGGEDKPLILVDEVKLAIRNMKTGKAPGEDGNTIDMIKEREEVLNVVLAELYNRCLPSEEIPEGW